jgi:hypothetical protein
MKAHDRRIIHSSEEACWRTPLDLFGKLDAVFHFRWDAAATAESTCVPLRYFGPDHELETHRNALPLIWQPRFGPYFLNPPYSRKQLQATRDPSYDIAAWAACAATQAYRGCTVVGLFPASTQTEWWYQYIRHGELKAQEIWEIPHRVQYLNPDGSPAANTSGGNTAVIVWRPNPGFVGDWVPAQRVWSYR